MTVYFVPTDRLGNAIFRYLACSLFCIIYNKEYSINYTEINYNETYCFISDDMFIKWMNASYDINIIEKK